jgi:hypothetical protein
LSEQQSKTENLLKTAFRPKQGITERLLCMRLIQATFANDVGSIVSNTCMAASMVKQLKPDLKDFDFRKFRVMKMMYSDINKTEFKRLPLKEKNDYYGRSYKTVYYWICPIPWSIPQRKDIYEKYIEPWLPNVNHMPQGIREHRRLMTTFFHKNGLRYSSKGCGKIIDVVPSEYAEAKYEQLVGKTCPECGKEIEKDVIVSDEENSVFSKPYWSYIFEVTQCLTHKGYKTLTSAFYEWCRDECGKAIITMGSLVSQNIYDEVLKQLKSQPEEEH